MISVLTDVQCPDGLRFGGLCDVVPCGYTSPQFCSVLSRQLSTGRLAGGDAVSGGRSASFLGTGGWRCFPPCGQPQPGELPTRHQKPRFFFFWPHWVFFAARARLSLAEAGGAAHCSGLSSQGTGSETVTLALSCFEACGIFPDQGSNRRPLDLQAD